MFKESGIELKRTSSNYPDRLPVKFNTAITPQKLSSTETVYQFSANGGYGVLSSTSMPTPYLIGAFALYLQAHG
ncbi:hypothetical protein BDB01DRAFT_854031 [Pilobolus umbonatus]|nr:hypothetical protein BDB01DRAFT_854031 [Pilobolus umbonatus]